MSGYLSIVDNRAGRFSPAHTPSLTAQAMERKTIRRALRFAHWGNVTQHNGQPERAAREVTAATSGVSLKMDDRVEQRAQEVTGERVDDGSDGRDEHNDAGGGDKHRPQP